jgi:hypothetical protein
LKSQCGCGQRVENMGMISMSLPTSMTASFAASLLQLMSKFKQELLTRFQGTDEGEVNEYLGCEGIRDRAARTGRIVQAGYAEHVLRTFGMWDCNPVLTPLDPNVQDMLSMYCGLARSCRPSCASTDEEHCGMSLSWLT